jgi:hypothetical protein
MPMIRETIVTTIGRSGVVHIAPFGIIAERDGWTIAPFRPSVTIDNLNTVPFAVANYTDDVRVFAGCLTGRKDWPITAAEHVPVPRLAGALAHAELAVADVADDAQRPRFHCRVVHRASHGLFEGLNRAKAAVIEAAILVSRLDQLPREQIEAEMTYLATAVGKTAGPEEQEAWGWLAEKVEKYYGDGGSNTKIPRTLTGR